MDMLWILGPGTRACVIVLAFDCCWLVALGSANGPPDCKPRIVFLATSVSIITKSIACEGFREGCINIDSIKLVQICGVDCPLPSA